MRWTSQLENRSIPIDNHLFNQDLNLLRQAALLFLKHYHSEVWGQQDCFYRNLYFYSARTHSIYPLSIYQRMLKYITVYWYYYIKMINKGSCDTATLSNDQFVHILQGGWFIWIHMTVLVQFCMICPQWKVGLGAGLGVSQSYKFIWIVQLVKYLQFSKNCMKSGCTNMYELATS